MSAVTVSARCSHPPGFRCVVCSPENFVGGRGPGEALPWRFHDGGRADAGLATGTDAGDCVCRAIAIATGIGYREVYALLADEAAAQGHARSARDGVPRKVYDRVLAALGWEWRSCTTIGSSDRVHLAVGELPHEGPLIARLSKHLSAVVDGVVLDNHDPTRGGTRMVYGYWTPASPRPCPDDGRCHHSCSTAECFRVNCCSPLSGVYPGDSWPASVEAALGTHREALA